MGKGEDFEREQCRFLSLWWTNGEDPDVFWRNRLRKTIMSPDGKHQCGDIMSTKAIGEPFIRVFNVECKSGHSKTKAGKRTKLIPWDLLDLIDYSEGLSQNKAEDKKFVLLDFWEQTETDAKLTNRLPMLTFKRDYHVPVVVIDRHTYNLLDVYLGLYKDVADRFLTLSKELYFFRQDQFFGWLTPEVVQEIFKGGKE